MEELIKQRDELVARLEKGDQLIESNRRLGQDVGQLEDHWIKLLRQYERICDRIRELTPNHPTPQEAA